MACHLIAEASAWGERMFAALDLSRGWLSSATAFALVGSAEFGDKSQLVCMTLAARHRHWPVWWGAVWAFILLNGIAVTFGATAGHWLPQQAVAAAVAVLFAGFGIHALVSGTAEQPAPVEKGPGSGIFVTTFLMIFLAEFGDKTQLAVAGLGAAGPAVPIWLGATSALAATSAVGIWAGRVVLQKLPQSTLHKISGILFLGFAIIAGIKAIPFETWNPLFEALKASRIRFGED